MSAHDAKSKVSVAVDRVLARYPLFGGLLATWDFIEDESVGTMAIGLRKSGFALYYSPKFVESLPLGEVEGVLHHEARHVVYKHPFMKPEEFPNEKALVIAQEVTVNEGIPEPLPVGVITLKDYPKLPPDEDTETRYDKLKGRCSQKPPVPKSKGTKKQQGTSAKGNGKDSTANKSSEVGKPASNDQASGKPVPDSNTGSSTRVQPIDNHSKWGEVRKEESFAKAIIESTLQGLVSQPLVLSEYEKRSIKKVVKDWSLQPGGWFSEIDSTYKVKTIDWRSVLRKYVGELLERVPSYSRPARRFPDYVGIIPGYSRSSGRPRILACIDTSGSMSDDVLGKISGELTRFASDFEVQIVEFDCVIHRCYKYRKPIKKFKGRGGTDFRPVLAPAFLKKQRPDLVILFTDGFGLAPTSMPQLPSIWVLTHDGDAPVSWGRVIRMM